MWGADASGACGGGRQRGSGRPSPTGEARLLCGVFVRWHANPVACHTRDICSRAEGGPLAHAGPTTLCGQDVCRGAGVCCCTRIRSRGIPSAGAHPRPCTRQATAAPAALPVWCFATRMHSTHLTCGCGVLCGHLTPTLLFRDRTTVASPAPARSWHVCRVSCMRCNRSWRACRRAPAAQVLANVRREPHHSPPL